MKLSIKEFMNRNHVNTRPIILVLIGLGFLSVILAATVLASMSNQSSQFPMADTEQNATKTSMDSNAIEDGKILAVVEKIDTDQKQITLYDTDRDVLLNLTYTGGTNITDKYDKPISMSQIDTGIMVDAVYDAVDYKLTAMNISKRAWEYPNVNNMTIDKSSSIMQIASSKYKYTDGIFIRNDEKKVSLEDLVSQDVLTVWGYKETIWSVIVTTGHGIVKLEDYADYLGDTINIGYEAMMQITDDFSATVREGTFNLTVENGRFSATKSITVLRNQVNYVSLGDLGPVGTKQCDVTFKITPFGADLYIDGTHTSYSEPVELSYGIHTLKASLGGYTSYEGTIDVDTKAKTIKINLPEAASDQGAEVSETDTNTDTSGNDTTIDTPKDSSDSSDTNTAEDDTKYNTEKPDYSLDEGDSLDSDHSIYIKAPDGASVYLDGDYMGTAPCKFDKIIGNHVLTFIKDGYKTMSYTVQVEDDGVDAYFTFPPLTEKK